jgi:hypothetical protein
MQTQAKPQTFFSEKQTWELKQLLGAISASEDYFLSAKKYLLDKDELTFDDALTVLITLQYSHYRGCLRRQLTDVAARRLREAIDMLTDPMLDKYLLPT